MKYTRLTKEQLEALHHDFARFLATQQITADEWDTLKKEKPHVAEQEIDIFSDLVWEKSLEKVRFLDKIDRQSLHCFYFEKENAKMISIILHNNQIDLTTREGFEWLQNNIQSPDIDLFTGKKTFTTDYKIEIFKLIEQGSQIADGTLFNTLSEYLKNESEK